jgi:hypothetical protein
MDFSFEVPSLEDLPNPAGRHVLVRADLDLPLGLTGNLERSRQRLGAHSAGRVLQALSGPYAWHRGDERNSATLTGRSHAD